MLNEDDVVLAMDRPWIEAGLKFATISKDDLPCLLVQRVARLRAKEQLDQHFLRYVIANPQFTNYILGVQTGTAVPHISSGQILTYEFMKPTIEQQRRIGEILHSIDLKIALNSNMNKTLEQISRGLFRHWFVDFEFPNEEGKPYKSSGGEMIDSEPGKIPKGWHASTLGDECNIIMGQSPSSRFYSKERIGLPFHQGVSNFGSRFPTHEVYCTIEERRAERGDMLFSVRAPVGRINVADRKLILGRGLAAIRHKEHFQSFLLYLLLHTFKEEDMIGSGTVFAAVTKNDMHNIKVVVPPSEIVESFEKRVSPMDALIAVNFHGSKTLSAIRDALLPKLLSGQIRVKASQDMINN